MLRLSAGCAAILCLPAGASAGNEVFVGRRVAATTALEKN
jgi:hypothetical protein